MGIFTLFKATKIEIDPNTGLKTSTHISTEDPELMRRIVGVKSTDRKESNKDSIKANVKPGNSSRQKKSTSRTLSRNLLRAPEIQFKETSKPNLNLPKKSTSVFKKPQMKKKPTINRNGKIEGIVRIVHNSRNLSDTLVSVSNDNSMMGTRGTRIKKEYEAYRKQIEDSALSKAQKTKLLDRLYNHFEKILKYDSQYISSVVAGPAKYPTNRMKSILDRGTQARDEFSNWWENVSPTIKSAKSKKEKEEYNNSSKNESAKEIREKFDFWYNKLLGSLEQNKKYGSNLAYSPEASLAMNYVQSALEVDTKLYKELFEKLNKVVNYRKNTNYYKEYNKVLSGSISNETVQKAIKEENKMIYSCSDYDITKMSIQAGERYAIKFAFYPKPQLVYALKRKGYIWYSYGSCFLCKHSRFDLEWAKNIKKQYEKYL